MMAQLSAIFDEWYAADISERWKADINHRKSRGITVGRPPFGTRRDKQTKYLIATEDGAWLLPDGSWIAGKAEEPAPPEGAIWRGYFQCAERILRLYAQQEGRGKIWQKLQEEGWAFRDKNGQPAPLEVDDIRRVVSNWPEYGGYVSEKRARERHPADYPPDDIIALLNPDRAVFDIDLLAQVAKSRQERALRKHPSNGVNRKSRAYPLAGITYCAHCEKMAEERNNPKLRSLLSGQLGKYYRHKPGATCGCSRKSVPRDLYERDFVKLIKLLEVKPESIDLLMQLAERLNSLSDEEKDVEQQKAEAIALCQRRIDAAVNLYGEGRIDHAEYRRRVESNEREMLSWRARTTETEKLATELTMCVQAIETMNKLWEVSDDENKQGMARHLFEYVVYDLDRQEIADFRLKPWADQFLVARVKAIATEYFDGDYNDNPVTLTGLQPSRRYALAA
jgi:hypothetical protein